ncbi:MAG: TolC family protein, partial [Bacteroidota bacterium]|nr:TolC family protein [Bacteroidota bacterium]
EVNATGSYTRIGPVPSITIPGMGSFTMAPNNNYNLALNYNQAVYDFGKTDKSVAIESENQNLSKQQLEQVKQKLSLLASNSYFSLAYLQEALKIKDEQIRTLKEHLSFVEKKKLTGTATEYEIVSTQVRISNAENQKYDLEASRKIQYAVLNALLGQPDETPIIVQNETNLKLSLPNDQDLISSALNQRDEMKIVHEKGALAQLQYQSAKSQNNPVVSTFVSAGTKNGYVPDLNTLKLNYVAGVGIRIPIYDGARVKNNLRLINSSIQINNLEQEITKRNISSEVVEKQTTLLTSLKKIDHYELQLKQAEKALSLAVVSYKAGALTNLDLLDANTAVSESRLLLLKSKIDYAVGIYNLKAAIGERLYSAK